MKPIASIALALCLLVPGSAWAIGLITDGDVTFEYTSFAQGSGFTTTTNFTGAASGDQTYSSWWFFRISGDAGETAFAAPDTESYVGNYATLGWTDVEGRGLFDADLNVGVVDAGATGGNLFQELVISANADIDIEVFHYTDFDLLGTAGDDSATLDFQGTDIQMTITDGAVSTPFIGYGADAYDVQGYPTLINRLTNAFVTNLGNNGLAFGPGDFTAAFQWSLSLTDGDTANLLTQFGTDAPLLPPTARPTPEPGTGVLMGLGLAGLAYQARRARRR